jgi:hypothetical protein
MRLTMQKAKPDCSFYTGTENKKSDVNQKINGFESLPPPSVPKAYLAEESLAEEEEEESDTISTPIMTSEQEVVTHLRIMFLPDDD